MNSNYKIIAVFEYSTEAHITKSKLDSEGLQTMLMDEKTIDSDPLMHKDDFEKALEIYNEIRGYQKDKNGNNFSCPNCNSNRVLIAPIQRKNVFYMLFPFFEKTRKICNKCSVIF